MRLFVDNLTNIDFSFLDAQRGLVGETWLAYIELEGELDDQGMICDFGVVKKTVRDWLDYNLDHCLLVPIQSPQLTVISQNEQIDLKWQLPEGQQIQTSAPRQAITLVDTKAITPDLVAQWCVTQLQQLFPDTVAQLKLHFNCEALNGPFYHYSHGLKKHNGNCQRITHGHRSSIEIWRNDTIALEEMHTWANKWRDIYIGTREDLNDESEASYYFEYNAQQGFFSLSLPKNQCYLIETDSTVEYIAQYIAECVKQRYPQERITVKAYEGIGKGAIVNL